MLAINKIYLIDAIKGLKLLDSESVDIVLVDPPYNIGKDFGNNLDKREMEDYVRWSKEYIEESIRVLKKSGTIFIYGFSEILAHLSILVPIEHRWLIWHYTNKTTPSLNFWQRSHESIIIAWKEKNSRIFNKDKVREPYTDVFLKNAAGKVRKNTKGRFSNGKKETIYGAHENGALPRDVLRISALAGGAGKKEIWCLCKDCDAVFPSKLLKEHLSHEIVKHPTQKPIELTSRLINSSMPKEQGLVVVPFLGSGSELLATKLLNMNFIGFEINEDYCKLAQKKVKAICDIDVDIIAIK